MQPLRSNDIRERNEKLILYLIYSRKSLSQSEVSAITGLKPPTVFRIFSILEEKGLIRSSDIEKDTGDKKGRKPVFYVLRPEAMYALGVDLWAQSAAVVLVDFTGKVIHKTVTNFTAAMELREVMDELCVLLEETLGKSKVKTEKILGIGIGAPGVVDIRAGKVISYSRINGMQDYDIREALEERFGVPVHVHNNCSVIALSSSRYGMLDSDSSLFAVLIRSGVGGAFIQNGRAFVNDDKTALEIGHVSIDMEGLPCSCGRRGCLESSISEDIILNELGAENLSDLSRILREEPQRARAVLEPKAGLLAHVIMDIENLLGVHSFIVICRSKSLATFLAGEAEKRVRETKKYGEQCSVIPIKYSPILAGKAASDLVFEHFFNNAAGEKRGRS